MHTVKRLLLNTVAGANVVTVLMMLATGFSDRVDPEAFPQLACLGMAFPLFPLANMAFLLFWVFFSWRRLPIALIGFVLAYTPINIYIPLKPMEAPPPGCLKVVSYNVHGYSGMKWGQDIFDSVYTYLVGQQADIVCLQEDNDTWRNGSRRFAQAFSCNDTVRISTRSGSMTNHVGIHSRFPVIRKERIPMPSATQMNGAAAFYMALPADTAMVIVAHLENIHLNSQDRLTYKKMLKRELAGDTVTAEGRNILDKLTGAFHVRAIQVKTICSYVSEHQNGHPVILCGDLNDTPISFTRHTLARQLTDCFVESGQGLGLSYNQKGFNFRIDHVFCSSHFCPYSCQIDREIEVSDHYPVVTWLKMQDKY